MKIRSVNLNDLDSMVAIEDFGIEDPWSRKQLAESLQNHQVRLAENETEVVGFLIYSTVLDESELLQIIVSPQYRRQGIGKSLMLDFFQELQTQRIKTCFLEVRKSNEKAQSLYLKLGFEPVGVRRNYYKTSTGKEDAVIMSKELSVSPQ